MHYFFKPGDNISEDLLSSLNQINEQYTKDKDFKKYLKNIQDLFGIQAPKITTEGRFFLGGFIEGEGSLNVSAKKHANAKFGILIDPEFSLTQHANHVGNLITAMEVFQTGRMKYKSGRNATLVVTIDNRKSLEEKVLPFYEKYITPCGSFFKTKRALIFKDLIQLFKDDCHKDLNCFVNRILPIWESLRMQKGQSNESFSSLKEAQEYVYGLYREGLASSPEKAKNKVFYK
jgi:hypothetical protein